MNQKVLSSKLVTDNKDTSRSQSSITGVLCLSFIAASSFSINLDINNLLHEFFPDKENSTWINLARAGKANKLKIKKRTIPKTHIKTLAFPVIFQTTGYNWIVLGGVKEGKALIYNPIEKKPRAVPLKEIEEQWSETILQVGKTSFFPSSLNKFNLGWFIESFAKYKLLFYEVLLASFFLQIFGLVTPLFFQVVIDKVLNHRSVSTLDVLAIGLLGMSIFEVILGGLRTWLFSHTAYRVDVLLGQKLFQHMTRLPTSYFSSRRVGDTVARVRELETLRRILTSSTMTLVVDTCFAIIFIVVMFLYSKYLGFIILAILPFYGIISFTFTPFMRRLLEKKFLHGAESQAFLVETISDIRTVKSMSVEPQFQKKWEELLSQFVRAAFRSDNFSNILIQIITFLDKLTTVLILWIGARAVIANELSVGELIAFNMLAQRVSGPIIRLAKVWQDLQQAGVSMHRLGDILNSPIEPSSTPGKIALPEIQGAIEFQEVSFRYRPETPLVLNNISFTLNPGESLGIVGQSGSGKSTIASLIQRLYVPEQGKIKIDGFDINMVDLTWLRRQLGVVLQDNSLFNKSIKDNIALAMPNASINSVIYAASQAGAHEFIMELQQGYDTIVGEHGSTLSGGQRQRIAIARALLTNPRILIFDEATSALDFESEHIIKKNMSIMSKGKSVILIAHRLSTIMECSHIIVLNKGNIVEYGTHKSLLQKEGGYYRKLWSYQSKDAGFDI